MNSVRKWTLIYAISSMKGIQIAMLIMEGMGELGNSDEVMNWLRLS